MGRPLIYLSGPISDGSTLAVWQQREHVHFATEFAFDLIRRGFAVFCPHWSLLGEQLVNQRIDHSLWIENDLPWIEASDALYRLPGDSKGADAEVAHAIEYEIPVYRDLLTLCDHFRGGLKNA